MRTMTAFDRPFRAWDGEGFDGRYTLLANSEGSAIYDEAGLSTVQCLDFLLQAKGEFSEVWFSFGYDVNMMLRDIPLTGGYASLETLYRKNHLKWEDYSIYYVPHKFFTVSRYGKSFSSTDVFGFFQSSFLKACEQWGVEVPAFVQEGKEGRNDFSNTDIWNRETIIRYNGAECEILVALMNKLREAMKEAGQHCNRWHGAGALAGDWHKRHGTKAYLGEFPEAMNIPLACAYFGGRIELGAWGEANDVYNYDITSAYPYAMAKCPNLANLEWEHHETTVCPSEPFSLVHVEWHLPDSIQWNPFPWRSKTGGILYPPSGRGWYWAVEVQSALRRFPSIRVTEAWVPKGNMEFPLQESIYDDFATRLLWKKEGKAAEKTLKLALNSLYGKTAQKGVKGQSSPPYQSISWAGYITATTRALLSDAILAAESLGGSVIQCMTDSIFTNVDCSNVLPLQKELGAWEEQKFAKVIFCGAGLYQRVDHDGNSLAIKQRGFGAADLDYETIVREWHKGNYVSLSVDVQRFIGMGLAIQSKHKYRNSFCQFVPMTRTLQCVPLYGTTKRLPDAFGGKRVGMLHFQKPRRVTKKDYVIANEPSVTDSATGFSLMVQDLRIPDSHEYTPFVPDGNSEYAEEKAVEYREPGELDSA